MNKIIKELVDRKVNEKFNDTVNAVIKASEEEITMSRKVFTLEVAVALLGGIILGMLISPRKKVSYKIASENHDIGDFTGNKHREEDYGDDDEYEEYSEPAVDNSSTADDDDDDDDDGETFDGGKSKFIKL